MSIWVRISVWMLAVVPAAWGLCPCWLAGAVASPAGAKRIAASVPACCPNCRKQSPLSTGKPQPPAPCKTCELMEAGKGTLPAQAVPPLPVAALADFAHVAPRLAVVSSAPADVPVVATGPPFVGLATVVLLI